MYVQSSLQYGKVGRCHALHLPLSNGHEQIANGYQKPRRPIVPPQSTARDQPLELSALTAIGPLDGRYSSKVRQPRMHIGWYSYPYGSLPRASSHGGAICPDVNCGCAVLSVTHCVDVLQSLEQAGPGQTMSPHADD
jgi:hypothetical protein